MPTVAALTTEQSQPARADLEAQMLVVAIPTEAQSQHVQVDLQLLPKDAMATND